MKKTIYINGKKETYKGITELRKKCSKYSISIVKNAFIESYATLGKNASIGKNAIIRGYASIVKNAFIESYATIKEGVVIGAKTRVLKKTSIDKQIVLYNHYEHTASGYIDLRTNKPVIQLGCYTRFVEDWDKDFDNNLSEFPKGSEERKRRLKTYKLLKKMLK